ncbi:outer membrane protein [Photobacterium nomapromontoriensis]|uniref:outer membrane protein n=1 Tax=Photobacterium nomapromontoriensis TaxID=2910237 RepID=UPI003D14910A
MKAVNLSISMGLLVISGYTFAADNIYIGADAAISNTTKLEYKDLSIDETNDLGANLFAGYNFDINSSFNLGIEAEYRKFGETSYSDGIKGDGQAFYINARPKFIDNGNNLYSAFILGIGHLSVDTTGFNESYSDSKIAYQVGVEAGYMIKNVDIAIGYRYQIADFDGVDMSVHGVTAGVRYNF